MKALVFALAVGVVSVTGCASQSGYLLKEGSALLRTSGGAKPISALLADPATPEDTRRFLSTVLDIRAFATREIGLKVNENYTRYKELDRDHLVDVVQACDAASFDAYQWSYPFLGRLPYRGYYERADADAEAARLRKEGYDVIVRSVDAFSTLGFLRDPLYSFMKGYSPFELASTLIHEQTHATLFLRNQAEFNEEMASFVGDTGALLWLRATYGDGSPEVRDALNQQADADLFTSMLHGLAARLQTVYDSDRPREEKLSLKNQMIDEFTAGLADGHAAGFRTGAYAHLEKLRLNNAYLSLYRLYTDDIPLLREWYQAGCGSDLRRFLQSMKDLSAHGDVKAQIRSALGRGGKAAGQ